MSSISRAVIFPLLLCALLASGCSAFGNEGRDLASAQEPPGQAAGHVASRWADGLSWSANGPVPSIVVDQFGYREREHKVAVLRRPMTGYDRGTRYIPGDRILLVDAATEVPVLTGRASAWHAGSEDAASGDRAWWFDFSSVTAPGRYYVLDPDNGIRSPEFVIDDAVYHAVLDQAVRSFFYQRAGHDKPAALAGSAWADAASHLGPGQDGEARSWLSKDDVASQRDLRGGWYDAGDYNKYTAWHAGYLIALLRTYHENPGAVGDDLRIPESGNGVSDLLDEIAWGLSWLVRMQQTDGSVLCVQGLDAASPPSEAHGPSFYGPGTTNATLKASAAFAYAAYVFAASGVPALAAQSTELTRRATSAWTWADANPAVTYFNNDESRQPGSAGLAAGQQETDDRGRAASKVEAAVHLFGLTGQGRYRTFVESNYQSYLPTGSQSQWTVTEQETLLHYASLPGVAAQVASRIRTDFQSALESGSHFLAAVRESPDPYRAPIEQYTWGSNQSKAAVGRMLGLATAYGFDPEVAAPALAAAAGYVHYLHGVNPLGLVYLTNVSAVGAEHSARTLFHAWFTHGSPWDSVTPSSPGPAPGFVVGGPNPLYSVDPCCDHTPPCGLAGGSSSCSMDLTPPRGQPPMKSYLQFNDGWPVKSWEITENSNGYQVQYIRLLAMFA